MISSSSLIIFVTKSDKRTDASFSKIQFQCNHTLYTYLFSIHNLRCHCQNVRNHDHVQRILSPSNVTTAQRDYSHRIFIAFSLRENYFLGISLFIKVDHSCCYENKIMKEIFKYLFCVCQKQIE